MDLGTLLARAIDPMSAENFLQTRNAPFTKSGVSPLDWYTHLNPADEQAFQAWARTNRAPVTPDYDMRGFWQGLMHGNPSATTGIDPNDQRLHFSDFWKTPLHESFSRESRLASPGAPTWNEQDQLMTPDGRIIFDDRQR